MFSHCDFCWPFDHDFLSGRQPKMFYVSSTSTTSTVSTTTLCYVSSNAAVSNTCSGRRKRRMVKDNLEATDAIKATAVAEGSQDGVIRLHNILRDIIGMSVFSSRDEDNIIVDEAGEDRKAKFLLYWMTTTSTSTTTTYTSTTTLYSLSCTPSGFTISNCSG